jgi:hypothetical protein
LGIESAATISSQNQKSDRFGPTREEILASNLEWQPMTSARKISTPLAEVKALHQDRWKPALRVASIVEPLGPGRLCKLTGNDRSFRYGKEVSVANIRPDGSWVPLPWVQKSLGLRKDETFLESEFRESVIPLMLPSFLPGAVDSIVVRGNAASVRLHFDDHTVSAIVDAAGVPLMNPPKRRAAVPTNTDYLGENAHRFYPPPGTAAHAWRTLGLVERDGIPTARGRIFSRFQGGEGLVIAAALEDATYPADEIVCHLANLRGGHRFSDLEGGASDRLAFATRSVYGHVDYDGYLDAGLCPGYGPGTWEAIERFRTQGIAGFREVVVEIRSGDIERATLEWFSLLRHIIHAPEPDAPRWDELQDAATRLLAARAPEIPRLDADGLPYILRQPATPRPESTF